MVDEASRSENAEAEYFVLPEDALQHLPDELRNQYETMASDGRAVLKSVDNELNQTGRLSRSFATIALLRHIQTRLSEYRFSADMAAIWELEMLVTAFVVTYTRLQEGKAASGFSRNALPENLRSKHDEIIELRNKRFAHETDHHTVTDMMEIQFENDLYEIHPAINFRVQIGGAPEWKELLDAVEGILIERSEKLIVRMTEKTGYKWGYAKMPD